MEIFETPNLTATMKPPGTSIWKALGPNYTDSGRPESWQNGGGEFPEEKKYDKPGCRLQVNDHHVFFDFFLEVCDFVY